MEYGWTKELTDFSKEVEEFTLKQLTPALRAELEGGDGESLGANGPEMSKVKDAIDAQGWLRMCWPPELGGEGKSPWYQYVMGHQMFYNGIPFSLGVAAMIGPAISTFGTPEQKEKYLPPLWAGDMVAALGYSEPNAGTDLASLQTRAVRDGDEWVINGQKIWTTGAHTSTHVWLAARTDPEAPKHRGISMFIVDLDLPGISVRPIHTSAGTRTNEVFYEDVRVPSDALIGEENRGWYIAANALDHERVSIGNFVGLVLTLEGLLKHIANDRPELLKDSEVRRQIAELKIDLAIARALALTNASIVASGDTPTMEASMVKVWSSELRYRMGNAAINILGRYGALRKASGDAAPMGGEPEQTYRSSPILRFGGGTNEVQRSIVAQRGLGLPR